MILLVIGLVLFLGVHSLGVIGMRDRALARLGEGAWKGLVSVVSVVGLGLIVYGFSVARQSPQLVYVPPIGLRHVALLLMLPALILLAAPYLPGRIGRLCGGHPMLVGTMLWGGSHLMANGFAHELVLFGGFLAWAVLDVVSYRWRPARSIPGVKERRFNDLIAVGAGAAAYVVLLLWGHAFAFGVAPVAL